MGITDLSVKQKTLKELYAKAAGRCALCPEFKSVFMDGVHGVQISNKNMSEAAHIIAQRKEGPRGKEPYDGDIDGYENLILLCPTHHKAIDDNPENFSSDWLRAKKKELEQRIHNSFHSDSRRSQDVKSLRRLMKHLAFTQLRGFCEDLPHSFDAEFYETGLTMQNFLIEVPNARPFFDVELETKFSKYENAYWQLPNTLTGQLKTKNNVTIQHYREAIQRGSRFIVPFNKGELYAHNESFKVQQNIATKRDSYLQCYLDLMNYLRFNYSEVDLNQ